MIEFDTASNKKLDRVVTKAIGECIERFNDISAGKVSPEILNYLFKKLSERDYRSESEIAIVRYMDAFKDGAIVTEDVPSIERTAMNSPKTRDVKNVQRWCSSLKKEHFIHIQKPFFKRYNDMYKDIVYSDDKRRAIKPDVILDMMRNMNSKGELK
jgi:hypothetical protein